MSEDLDADITGLQSEPTQDELFSGLRPIDRKRVDAVFKHTVEPYGRDDIWFIHAVLAQCFLPYRNPKSLKWHRRNGDFSISLTAGEMENPSTGKMEDVGLPYGAKPRLFQSYICTQALRHKSPVISVEPSMTAMMHELGYKVTGGKEGTINKFKDQITRFAACHFTIVGPGPRGTRRHVKTPPIKRFDVWFPSSPQQKSLWPSEIVLSDDYYHSLVEHAIPYDFRGLQQIQNNARAQDIYLWMTQRLCRLSQDKPLFMTWPMLFEMFSGNEQVIRYFKPRFRAALQAARTAYPAAVIDEENEGFRFYYSPPPIQKTKAVVHKPVS